MSGDRYSNFVFTPAELAEDVDLPLDARKEILFLEAQLGRLDHWALLGVRWNAPTTEVRNAYLEKAKIFHPDRHGGRSLGSYRSRIEKIFKALTEARDALADERTRTEYVRRTAPPEEFARMEARRLEDEARAGERRARLSRANPIVARATRVQELVRRGRQLMEAGKYVQAANDFLTVVGIDPRHPEARALAEQAKKRAGAMRARELYDQGLAAEAVGNLAAARVAFREAALAEPGAARYSVAASRAALEAGEIEEARSLAEQAVRSGPRDPRAVVALGAALQAQGESKAARRAFERALELDPEIEAARAALKKLRWSFLG